MGELSHPKKDCRENELRVDARHNPVFTYSLTIAGCSSLAEAMHDNQGAMIIKIIRTQAKEMRDIRLIK